MPAGVGVDPVVFRAISCLDVSTILGCKDEMLRPILACLVRMSLIAPLDQSPACLEGRTSVLQVLSRIELVNSIVALLSIDFHALETDVRKEQQLRQKTGASASDSVLVPNMTFGHSLEFEKSDATRKLRLVLSELLAIMAKTGTREGAQPLPVVLKASELFDHRVYLPEVCDVLAIALAELPTLLQPTEVCEALLRLKHGPEMICHVVANQSDSFWDVATHLLTLGEKQDDEGLNSIRQTALLLLCQMNPDQALAVRGQCVETCRMPGLAVLLSLQHAKLNPEAEDLVPFLSGLLLGTQSTHRSWISFFVRNGQKRKCPALAALRVELSRRVGEVGGDPTHSSSTLPPPLGPGAVREASALLRLYTALRGVAGMKFTEEEVELLVALITRRPPSSPAVVRLVSLGLSMLIACNSLIGQPALERRATDWIRYLVEGQAYQEGQGYGEMLLLTAIHFHAGQLSAVADLVCQTTGIKMTVRTNGMARIKQIFTNEIFTESVVAAHAVKVPVTPDLSSNHTGFLPVHCIHQLLKSRVFSKHRVSIKSWIYQQILSSTSPLHPVLPPLIEVFVNSILLPSSSRSTQHEHLNEPLTEAEVRSVFQPPHFSLDSPGQVSSSGYTAQLAILYYILLYEDTRLSSGRNLAPGRSAPLRYSADLLADLPLKFLLGRAESRQSQLEGLYPSILRLCASHFPHLCLVEDWLRPAPLPPATLATSREPVNEKELRRALVGAAACPAAANIQLGALLALPARLAWQHARTLVSLVHCVLEPTVPRHTQELYRQVWLRMNTVYPRQLWLLTVNHLTPPPNISQEDLALDPLAVLRCDDRVFRTAPLLSILLYMLKACLAASRSRLCQYLQDQPPPGANTSLAETEREELKNSLVLTQESAAIQILLETCQPGVDEEEERGSLSALQETRSLVCCYLHQAFIEDTNLAKLVHFQGYPHSLLPVTAQGVPSMFICLNTAPELLSQPSLEKQVFAVDLISHLSVVCAMPNSLSIARLALNCVWTLLGVLAAKEREELIRPSLPALARICRAFPPLMEDTVQLLIQAARMWLSSRSVSGYTAPRLCTTGTILTSRQDVREAVGDLPGESSLAEEIVATFETILGETIFAKRVF